MIYVVKTSNMLPAVMKIGFTKEITKRFRALELSSPVEVEIVETFEGSMLHERALHRYFKDFRVRGEWFRNEAAAWEIIRYYQTRRGLKVYEK